MPSNDKDTIYIDIDDEITGIIDKLKVSSGKVTALVLPKRAGVFQSIVNMKLLKRAADESGKHLVLITNEAGLLPLAGAAGIHVAKTLNSKPDIPTAPKMDDAAEEAIDETGAAQEVTAATAGQEPIGKLADADDGVETLELDDDEIPEDSAGAPTSKKPKTFEPPAKAKGKGKKAGGFKIPDFNKFRTKLIIGGLALLLLILFIIFGMIVLPHATINIKTDATNVPVSLNLNLSTTAKDLNPETSTVPAKLASDQKTYSQQVPTTGQKNNGSKAGGNITMSARECPPHNGTPSPVPAGTGVSANGQTYITQKETTFSNPVPDGTCNDYHATSSTPITAQSGGTDSNTGNGSSFSVAGRSDASATGSASGGTDNIVQVVNQNDINNAKAKISASKDNVEKQVLKDNLNKDGYFAITSTFSAGAPNTTQSAQVGNTANSVTVTEVITYTMFGAKEKDLDTLVDNTVKDQVDTSKQTILGEGLDKAVFGVSSNSKTGAQLTLQTTAEVGPDLNIAAIKQAALGKKPGDVKVQLQGNPDVTDVNVDLSPFWVSSIPKKESKVTVKIAKPTTTKSNANANNP